MVRNEKFKLWCEQGAQDELDKLLRDGTIPIDRTLMGPKVAYEMSEVFKLFEYAYFRNKLNDLRNKYKERRNWAQEDDAALASDMLVYDRPTHNARGEPLWDGSAAQPLLKLDLPRYLKKKKKGSKIKPRDLYRSRPEYKVFKLKTFRKHVYQEIKLGKFHNYLKAKAEAKKGGKKKKITVAKVVVDLSVSDDSSDDGSDDSTSQED